MMTFEQATNIILKECEIVKNDPRFDELEIDLMGGEPMMNFTLIRQLVEWAEALPLPVPYIFFMTTNGTLFDAEAEAWFKKHGKTMWAGVSCDGTEEMQTKNRGAATKSIDYAFFHETWPKQPFHLTISKESLPYLAEGVIAMQRKGWRVEGALASGIDWDENDAAVYDAQLTRLKEFYLENTEFKPLNLLTCHLLVQNQEKTNQTPQKKYCGSGTYMQTYDIDGKAYGCHMFSPIVLGSRAFESTAIDWTCSTNCSDPFCETCVLKQICPTCAGFNYRYRNSLGLRDHHFCRMVLVEAQQSADFEIKYLAKYREELSDEDAFHARALLEAVEVLSSFALPNVAPPFEVGK